MEKKCIECGESFKGRIDKKFCSDLCRNAFNNKQNSDTTNYMRSVNTILRKNRRILLEYVERGKGKANVHRQKLNEKGFNFSHLTHTLKTQKGIYFFCYEYGYLPLEKDFFLLVKRNSDRKEG
ncbi:MAG: DUF2116 family Zn-ribbon domain-containing protein [Bacteroidetes bacterium]|nr:DUF2116 family Zn-ribbon domain-containing protein [Bacteroidota bacterium]